MKKQPTDSDPVVPAAQPNEPVIYVVDDDISVRESLGNLMRSVGLRVELFASALEFRRQLPARGRCCLVLDVRLPGLSGLDLQAEMIASGDKMPIVFITGHGDVPMSVRAMKAGALEFLQKPFREQDLLDAIHLALAKLPAEAEAGPGSADRARVAGSGSTSQPGPELAVRAAAAEPERGPREALARNIQLGRAIFNWSQEELGNRCGLHRSHISSLERAELSVGVDAIDSIAAAFGVSPHVVLMPPAEAQSVLLESFNGVATKPALAARAIKPASR